MLATHNLATVQTHDLGGLLSPNTILNSEIAFPAQTLIKTLIRHEVLQAKMGTFPLGKQPSQKSQAWQETGFPRAWSYVGQAK